MNAPQVPPAGAPASPSAATAGLVSVPSEIVRLPQELAARLLQTPRTVFLTGTVTGQAPDGALQVRSQLGEIALRAGTNVPPDRQVSLQIPPLSGKAAEMSPAQLARSPIPVSLLLPRPAAAQVAGQAAASPAPAGPSPGPQSPPAPAQALQSAPAGPATRASAPAPTITTAGPAPAGAPPTAPTLPGSTNQAGGIAPQSAAPQPQLPATGGTTTAPTAGGTTTAPAGGPPSPAPSGATVANPATGGQPAGAVPQLGRPALSPQVVTQAANPPATTPVQSQAPQGQAPQGQAPAAPGPQASPAQASAPSATNPAAAPPAASAATVGSAGRAGETARPAPPPLPVAPGAGADDALPVESARRVPVLREAVSILSATDPALAAQFVRSVVPQGNSQLAATLLFFLSATRGGDIRGWVGDRVTSRMEDAGRADMLPRLSAELAGTTRPAPDPAAGEWRSQTIPLYQDGDIGGLTMHVRAPGDENGSADDTGEGGRRFLIDLDLSRMGPLQLDGLVREKRLDVTIRSQAAFPETMRQDMRTLFRDASETVGLHGGLTFQAGGHDWVTVANARGGA